MLGKPTQSEDEVVSRKLRDAHDQLHRVLDHVGLEAYTINHIGLRLRVVEASDPHFECTRDAQGVLHCVLVG
jgi:hypothetical protein